MPPLKAYYNYCLQTPWFFAKDQLKQFILGCVINSTLLSALVWVIQWGGQYFYLYAWGVVGVFVLVLMTIYPDYIAPLFDKVLQ
jgi:STE24 endopeptidase